MTAEVLKQLDLAQSALGENLLAEDIGDLLDGHAFVGLGVDGGASGQVSYGCSRGLPSQSDALAQPYHDCGGDGRCAYQTMP